jgi:hypothetical protein
LVAGVGAIGKFVIVVTPIWFEAAGIGRKEFNIMHLL